jgi:dTDP-4-amino-4,6-dideoxygalactose transaminase
VSGTVVPFNRPTVAPNQIGLVEQSLASGRLAGDGPFTHSVTETLGALHGGARVMLTPSCTAALELAGLLLQLRPGDEVIVPSFTFVTTASAFALTGARLVFGDIDPGTLCLDLDEVERLVTPRTRAVVPVHYGGVAPSPLALEALTTRHGAVVIEDNAHGLFGTRDGRALGTTGALSTLSFHETKNITCGEGGALVLNDPDLVERAEILREKGTDRSRFFRGMVDKYSWVDLGSSYLLADVNAALLAAQLEHKDEIQDRRRRAWHRYRAELAPWARDNGVAFQEVPEGSQPPHHLFALLLPALEQRQRFLGHLRSRGVTGTFHYLPLHQSAMGRRLGCAPSGCPVSVDVSDRLARLPLFSDITESEVDRVIEATASFEC